jgi:hypothetical protein
LFTQSNKTAPELSEVHIHAKNDLKRNRGRNLAAFILISQNNEFLQHISTSLITVYANRWGSEDYYSSELLFSIYEVQVSLSHISILFTLVLSQYQ